MPRNRINCPCGRSYASRAGQRRHERVTKCPYAICTVCEHPFSEHYEMSGCSAPTTGAGTGSAGWVPTTGVVCYCKGFVEMPEAEERRHVIAGIKHEMALHGITLNELK